MPGHQTALQAIARFRPFNDLEKVGCRQDWGPKSLCSFPREDCVVLAEGSDEHTFTLCRVFTPEAAQIEVFSYVAQQLVEDVLEGYNATIFAYGQTGSGKTYTMLGPDWRDEELKGIVPRAAELLFAGVDRAEEGSELSLKCSVLEIYKEKVRDLLDPQERNLPVKEGPNGIYVEGLTALYVISVEELLSVLDLGASNRSVAVTKMNKASSRSHQLVLIEVTQVDVVGRELRGKLNLVDLAGSEKASAIADLGENFEEMKKINLSLSALGKVIHSLTTSADHIPYRDSKLTRLLQESLSGNFKTALIVTCSPHARNLEETISSLRFGERAGALKTSVRRNVKESCDALVASLQEELFRCRTELRQCRESGEIVIQTPRWMEDNKETIELKEEIAAWEKRLTRKNKKLADMDRKLMEFMDSGHAAAFHYSESQRKCEELAAQVAMLEQANSLLTSQVAQLQLELKSAHSLSPSTAEFIERPIDESAVFSPRTRPQSDCISPSMTRRELPLDPDCLLGSSLYASAAKDNREGCSIHCFLLRNQLTQAAFLNAGLGQAYQALEWRLQLTELKLDLSEQTVSRLEGHLHKQHELVTLLQASCSRVLLQAKAEESTPLKWHSFVRRVDRHSQRAREALRSCTPLASASPGAASDLRVASPFSLEPDEGSRLRALRNSLELQELQSAQLHELLAAKTIEADSYLSVIQEMEQMVFTAHKLERAKWSEYLEQYRENCEAELVRRQKEVSALSKALARWVEKYTDLQSSVVVGLDTTWRFDHSIEQNREEELKAWGRSLFLSETSVLSDIRGASIEMEELGRSRGDLSPIDPED